MIQENEIVTLILNLSVIFFFFINRKKFDDFPGLKYFELAVFLFFTSSVLTVLEGFFYENAINTAEHFTYLASSVTFLLWIMFFAAGTRRSK